MGVYCIFFRYSEQATGLYALAVCAHFPLRGASPEVRHFSKQEDLAAALSGVGVLDAECLRILKALKQYGRTLTHFTNTQLVGLRGSLHLQELEGAAIIRRPETFHVHRVAARPVTYQLPDAHNRCTSSGGVLRKGQEVWFEGEPDRSGLTKPSPAFVEGIGFLFLDKRGVTSCTARLPKASST